MPPVARLISLGILTTLIVALGITFYHVLAPFLLPLFLAWVTAILCRPLYLWCIRRTNGRPRLAASLTTLALLVAVLLPLVLGTAFAAGQLIDLATTTIGNPEWRDKVKAITKDPRVLQVARRIPPYLLAHPEGVVAAPAPPDAAYLDPRDPFVEDAEEAREASPDLLTSQIEASLKASLRYIGGRTIGAAGIVPGVALGVIGRVVSLLVALVMFAIALYYFLCDGPELLAAAENLIPVRIDYQRELLARFDQVVRAVVLSTFLSALAQGLLTTIALGVAGFDHLLIFFVLASLAAMIPLAGTWIVWAPCAVWLAWFDQRYGAAILLAAFGIIVVGTIDNLIRTYILNSSAKLHPLLAFVSVLGGLQVMGLWGVFIAPVVAACLHALIEIFNTELRAFSQERSLVRPSMSDDTVTPPVVPAPGDAGRQSPYATNDRNASQTKQVAKPATASSGRSKRRRR